MKRNSCFLVWVCLGGVMGMAQGQVSDSFDDGDDAGWTRLSPLEGQGGTSTYSFPGGNTYRIQAGVSPDPVMLGQSRAGSLLDGVSHSAFRISVDIVDTDAALKQDIGILTRVSSPGLGTLNGYSATFETDESRAYLSRVDAERPTILEYTDLALDPAKDYRIVFHGFGGQFLIEVFELPDLTAPIGLVTGTDDTYSEGATGLFGSAGPGNGTVDVTFDNFEADDNPDTDRDGMEDPAEMAVFGNLDEEGEDDFDGDGRSNAQELEEGTNPKVPDTVIELSGFSVGVDFITIQFQMPEEMIFRLEKSSDLKSWVADDAAVFTDLGAGIGEFVIERSGESEYVRVSEVNN